MRISPPRRGTLIAVAILAVFFNGCSRKPGASRSESPGTNPATAANPAAAPPPPALPPGIPVPPGTRLMVRMNRTIDVKYAAPGDGFGGTIAAPVVVGDTVAIPQDSEVVGEVLRARRRGRFKGRSVLELTLTGLQIHGIRYRIDTTDAVRTKKGKGRRSAALIGGGAGLGMLIGGVAGGGTGLLIGGLAGGGAGTMGAAFTGNRDIRIPAESIVAFRLERGIMLAPPGQAAGGQ